ncbi:cytochrome p450 domain-containing protein [Hirsutella rhossiliensis]|uniref:Cytochrome p450 domain-containing protein n=1 Tax=Hirsutella rhossiliensis TaxID=111463 RepID=A0A9P8N5S0_9HYPO|nr:cytochrome p450 domain-containing protein [Hirsutella rhossiliensis]KAH0967284.1 cytochrome p450 domain-containing protein [Hirsutella rhossiliensis]
MGPPLRQMTAGAVAGGVLLMSLYKECYRGHLAELLVALGLAQFVVWGVWSTFVYPHFVSPLRHLPQPEGAHWLLGHGRQIIGKLLGGPVRQWVKDTPHDGLIRYLFLFNRERLVVVSPKALAEVLVTKNYVFEKPDALRGVLGRQLGNGILLAEGDEHKAQRRNLLPAFQYRHIKDLYPTFWAKASSAVRAMTAACGDGPAVLEVNSWASRCTLDIIGAAGMGVDFGAIENDNNELAQTYTELSRPSRQGKALMVLGIMLPGWLLNHLPLKHNREIEEKAERIRAVCRRLIRDKKQRLAAKEAEQELDILTVALGSGLFGDEQLVDQLMTFLAAGHDTTASALTWALYQLSRFPEMQRRLRDEVRSRLPPPPPPPTDADGDKARPGVSSTEVDGMPPVSVTMREAVHDTTIQGQVVRRGTRIILAPWATNVDPALWGEDAGEFRPERWLSSEASSCGGGASSNYAFLTFLHGPRSCIGAGFARAELACILAAWVGRFEFELADAGLMDERKLRFKMAVTTRPADGMHLRTRVVPGW